MKTGKISMAFCITSFIILAGFTLKAQSVHAARASSVSVVNVVATFTYKIFQAPNKMYGYDNF